MRNTIVWISAVILCAGVTVLTCHVSRADDTPPNAPQLLPSLYVLAIGVADYPDENLKREFADEDARRVAKTLSDRALPLYNTIETRLVVNKDATQLGVLDGLAWLKEQMTSHDVGIMFFSGQTEKDEQNGYNLLPSDFDQSNPLLQSGISSAQVKEKLQEIPGRFILMLDSDHAGSFGGDRRKKATALNDGLVREVSEDHQGIIVMASSTGREVSLVSDEHKSGIYTLAIIEGLNGKADLNKDSMVYFNELDLYASDRVKTLTKGMQHPVSAKPRTIRPFPLTTVK